MALVVQKYGGSSVADAEGIKRVAKRIVATQAAGNQVVVVVSAMGDTTDELIGPGEPGEPRAARPRARHAADLRRADLDGAARHGDRHAWAWRRAPSPARRPASSPMTCTAGRGSSTSRPAGSPRALAEGAIPIVAGFQGVSQNTKDITTLGRGGSDTTAVALAAALQRGRLRDLHRRGRGVHRGPADRAERAQDPADHLRGNAGDGRVRREGPDTALRGVRAPVRRADSRPFVVQRQDWYLGQRSRWR